MKIKLGNPNDVCVGLFFVATSLLSFWINSDLAIGTLHRMGPGYFPLALGWILLCLGIASILRGIVVDTASQHEPWSVRALLGVVISIAFFALSIEPLGVVASVFGLVLVGSVSDRESKPAEALLLSLGLALFCVFVFVYCLGLALHVMPEGLR